MRALAFVLDLAAAYPRELAAAFACVLAAGWSRLPKRRRRRIRSWCWRQAKRSARWAWREAKHSRRPATVGRPPARSTGPTPWPVEPGGPTVLYRHYDAGGRLLYVGITDAGRGGKRWLEHQDDKPWFCLVAHSTVSHPYPTKADALYAEAVAIRDENPIHNIARPNPDLIGRA
jgi:hypothetical protein